MLRSQSAKCPCGGYAENKRNRKRREKSETVLKLCLWEKAAVVMELDEQPIIYKRVETIYQPPKSKDMAKK